MVDYNDSSLVRKALIDELEAINYYEDFIQRLESPEARTLMAHISVEEKEHMAELAELLSRLDPAQAQKLDEELKRGLKER